jgi:hypothetical protein
VEYSSPGVGPIRLSLTAGRVLEREMHRLALSLVKPPYLARIFLLEPLLGPRMPLGSAQVPHDLQIQHCCTDIYSHRRCHTIRGASAESVCPLGPGNETPQPHIEFHRCAARLLSPGDPISVASGNRVFRSVVNGVWAERGSAHGTNEYGSTGRLRRQIICGYRSSMTMLVYVGFSYSFVASIALDLASVSGETSCTFSAAVRL